MSLPLRYGDQAPARRDASAAPSACVAPDRGEARRAIASGRIRIGLHTGEAIKEADDFFGSYVNLAARVGGAAKGDEILVSGLLKALTESAGEFTFDEGRQVELKGISGPQRMHAVAWQ